MAVTSAGSGLSGGVWKWSEADQGGELGMDVEVGKEVRFEFDSGTGVE
jgi:hypothetical protein